MKIYSKDTFVQIIETDIANNFLKENDGSVAVEVKAVSYGLFYKKNNELMGVMQFCSPRDEDMKQRYSLELVRLCFKQNSIIIGGASKLFNFFIDNYRYPTDIFIHQNTIKLNSVEITTNVYEEWGLTNTEINNDKIYIWNNPNITHYTYKITASDSNKYYYGVSHVAKNNASAEDCLNNKYTGSGGRGQNNKFRNWKKKHKQFLQKEIMGIFPTKEEAYNHEKELIGSKWINSSNDFDPLCLNSFNGGLFTGMITGASIELKECEKHGVVKHFGNKCAPCRTEAPISVKNCKTHGEAKHRGDSCYKCDSIRVIKNCEKDSSHGFTSHQNNSCYRCEAQKSVKEKECRKNKKHGITTHFGEACGKCRNENNITNRDCTLNPLHLNAKHRGNNCYLCSAEKTVHSRNHKNVIKENCSYCKI